jgi:hypothetical protein
MPACKLAHGAPSLYCSSEMKCIDENQIAEWLHQRSIHKDPYHGDAAPAFYLQFYAPKGNSLIDGLIRHYYDQILHRADSMIHMTDWETIEQSQMMTISKIRSSHGEERCLIDAPGHILTWKEKELGISLFHLSASFGWSSYLYSPQDHSTLFNWEGEIFDFWTDRIDAITEMKLMLHHWDLTETSMRKS